jgi:hypothetical protein
MMAANLVHARQLHEAGRYADAARSYDALLARWPDHAEALPAPPTCPSPQPPGLATSPRSGAVGDGNTPSVYGL